MQSSMFNLRVPLEGRDEVFLMNTLTDAQLVVSSDVAALLDRAANADVVIGASSEEREALTLLRRTVFSSRAAAPIAGARRSIWPRSRATAPSSTSHF